MPSKLTPLFVVQILLWPLYVSLQIPLWLAGFPLCYLLAKREAWELKPSRYFKPRIVAAWTPRWCWLYCNDEDGVVGPAWWHDENAGKSQRWLAFVWSAWRNPTNNLRFLPFVNVVIDPARVQWLGNADDPAHPTEFTPNRILWSFTWQGLYAGLVWRWQVTSTHHIQLRLGWKLLPRDRFGVPAEDFRSVMCPFGVQFHPWRIS